MSNKIIFGLIAISFLTLSACSPGFKAGDNITSDNITSDNSKLNTPNQETPPQAPVEVPPPVIVSPAPQFCSKLDLVGITWPAQLDPTGQSYLGLALNITGSFEGRQGWANLSNNFDGMGFSIGLLQQNLGMGSLQPILDDMVSLAGKGVGFALDPSSFVSIQAMVAQWNDDRAQAKGTGVSTQSLSDPFFPDDAVISPSDLNSVFLTQTIDKASSMQLSQSSMSTANQNSVAWAIKTVYSDAGTTFKPSWADNLSKMAQSKAFVGLQLKYAMKIYSQAFQYFKAFQLTTLSNYLLMFDFVVQNGGFKKSLLVEYTAQLTANPKMTDQEKALLILQLRIKDVLPRWQNDVSDRKKAIIFSEGQVHGAKRNLKIEYCYVPESVVLTQP